MKKWDPNWTAEKVGSYWVRYDNYWAGAKKACDELGMSLPELSKLESLAKKTTAEKEQLGLPAGGWFWSSEEDDAYSAYYVYFSGGRTYDDTKDNSTAKVLCVGD